MNLYRDIAKRVLQIEANALLQMSDELTQEFDSIIETLQKIKGRIILVGVGKSGHVARKIAATLSSTGSPALYVHPTEASHGDMGMITSEDAVIALSRSGETKELADVIAFCRRFSVPLIALTAEQDSNLGKSANHALILANAQEACAETRAPTTSTTLQMALGDAVAVALLEAKGFTASDFKNFHPGGSLGASLLTVEDLMHVGDALPLVSETSDVAAALDVMNDKGFGCIGIMSGEKLVGIITDGDIRRNLSKNILASELNEIMTANPKTSNKDELAADALRRMTSGATKITQLFVTEAKRPIGLVHLHDFLRAGLM